MKTIRTTPEETAGMPTGIPYIIGNEAAERFSYYGMKTILVVFMTTHLMGANGHHDPMTEAEATGWYHLFGTAVYATPLIGAIIADWLWGKYRTIMILSVVYCLGHLALALDETRMGLAIGLTLIAIGAGGIKPCVSAHVGDQFGLKNRPLLEKVFGWFYFSINFGSFISTLLTPWLLEHYGPGVAFGVPGALMAIATFLFWLGRHSFVHVPAGGPKFIRELFNWRTIRSMGWMLLLYWGFIAMFWALFDQTGSTWVLQARYMDTAVFGLELLPSQIQAANPILILVLIPVFHYLIYPAIDRVFPLTPLRKIGIGLFVMVPAFLIPAWIETQIPAEVIVWQKYGLPQYFTLPEALYPRPSIGWQLLAYVILTSAEVMVSITALEFSYTQAPKRLKSLMVAFTYLLSVSVGNLFTSVVNFAIITDGGTPRLSGASYYIFFAGLMGLMACAFVLVARHYKKPVGLDD